MDLSWLQNEISFSQWYWRPQAPHRALSDWKGDDIPFTSKDVVIMWFLDTSCFYSLCHVALLLNLVGHHSIRLDCFIMASTISPLSFSAHSLAAVCLLLFLYPKIKEKTTPIANFKWPWLTCQDQNQSKRSWTNKKKERRKGEFVSVYYGMLSGCR